MTTIQVGDIVKRNKLYKYYQTISASDRLEVLELKENQSGNMVMRLKKLPDVRGNPHNQTYQFSQNSWYSVDYFQVVEERSIMNGKNDIFLVFAMIPQDDESHKINLEAGAVQYPSEKDAKAAVARQLEDNPETIWGIFPLAYLVKVEKPPVKFTVVWKR